MNKSSLAQKSIVTLIAVAFLGFYSCKQNPKKETADETATEEVAAEESKPDIKLSLAQWSMHKMIFEEGVDPYSFAEKASEWGFEGLEYVSGLYYKELEAADFSEEAMNNWVEKSKAESEKYGLKNLLIMVDGQGDIAVSYQPSQHLHVAEGLPLLRVGTLVATPLNCLLVLKDGPIKDISQLKGGKIGFSVAGVEEAVLSAMLRRHGVKMDDVEMVNVNFSLSPSLMSGQVDAVIGAYRNFELNQMEIEGVEGRCFYVEEEGVPTYDELIYVANPDRMDIDQTRRFLRATELATQYIVNNPSASWELFKGYAPELNDELNAKAWVDTLPRFALRPEALDEGRYTRLEAFLAESGLVDGTRPVSEIAVDLGAE